MQSPRRTRKDFAPQRLSEVGKPEPRPLQPRLSLRGAGVMVDGKRELCRGYTHERAEAVLALIELAVRSAPEEAERLLRGATTKAEHGEDD